MSTLRLTTISNQSGSSSVPSDTIINGSAKAWVNFNGTGTVAIRASFNVSSITDNGTGNYTVNFTSSFADTNYAVCATAGQTTGGGSGNGIVGKNEDSPLLTVSAIKMYTLNTGNSTVDYPFIFMSFFR